MQEYERIEYGSHLLRTADSERNNKNADSYVRMDYMVPVGRSNNTVVQASYGQIKRLFVHYMYEDGPFQVVAEVDWYDRRGEHKISGLPLVSKTNRSAQNFTKLTFVRECYPRPLAIWPNDPMDDLDDDDPAKYYFRVIDRNEDETLL